MSPEFLFLFLNCIKYFLSVKCSTAGDFAMPGRPGSVVKSMTRAIADLAPDLLRDEKFAEARQYQRADHDKAEGARSKGHFHSEGSIAFSQNPVFHSCERILTHI
jgi:hypothetical protein